MKFIYLIFIGLLGHSIASSQPTFDLFFQEIENNGSNYSVDILLSFSSTNTLASSNFVFTYNNAALSNPTYISGNSDLSVDYTINASSLTSNSVSLNIFQPVSGNGTMVGPTLIRVGRIQFNTIDFTSGSMLTWRYDGDGASTGTVVFRDDGSNASTQLNADELNDLNTIPLPVELLFFKAQKTAEQQVRLNWETASEINNNYFEVQRLHLNKDIDDPTAWQVLGIVKGQGTSLENHAYTWLDKAPFWGDNYYRLRQVDFDGTFAYSRIINISFKKSKSDILIYPNPVGEILYYQGASSYEIKSVELLNAEGQIMWENTVIDGRLEVSNLPQG
ncbi:MAG: T9SS type A sorting domain-containing protein, partial [Bacteroidota bacterium]